MESYKRVVLSLTLLLSTPLATFCMEDLEDGVHLSTTRSPSASSSHSNIIPSADIADAGLTTPANTPNTPNSLAVDVGGDTSTLDIDDIISIYYTPRPSIQYIRLEDFDKRSVDDLNNDQSYKDLLRTINATETNTPPASPRIPTPQIVMGAGVAGAVVSALNRAAPAIRSIRTDETKSPILLLAGWIAGAFQPDKIAKMLFDYKTELAIATFGSLLIFETRKSVHLEEDNKRMTRKIGTMHDAIQRLAHANKKHELIEQGMIATEHKVLMSVHDYLREEAAMIAKGSAPNQAVATLKAILEKNKKITKKVVLTMADLEKIHTDTETLLKDEKKGWFSALTSFFHKHSSADIAAAAEDK